jgi:hypothetical protein
MTKLKNQSVLTQIAYVGGKNEGGEAESVLEVLVRFRSTIDW